MTWTLKNIRAACEISADDWAFAKGNGWGAIPWLWIIYVQRLVWTYGERGALARLNEGRRVAA